MKKLDSKILKIQSIIGVRNLINEASKKDVLIKKLGVSEKIAEYFDRVCGGLAVIMFKKFIDYVDNIRTGYDQTISDPKEIIKFFNDKGTIPTDAKNKLHSIMDWVRVGLNGRLNQYQDFEFINLYEKSQEWHDSLSIGQGEINYKEENDIIKDFRNQDGFGFYWADLNTNDSNEECNRMGHCGRTGSQNNIYSLREQRMLPGGKFTLNKSHLTASIGRDGTLYQLKGPKNSKPQEEYHKYILPLFFVLGGEGEEDDYLIRGFGSEYASDRDFKITDLPDETIKQIYEQRPELFSSISLRSKLYEMGLLEKPTFGSFTLKISPGYISDYVDGDWVIGTRRWIDSQGFNREKRNYFFEALLTDPWDIVDRYDSSDWSGALSYYVDDRNEKKIREYLLSLSENPTEDQSKDTEQLIEDLDGDYEVRNAISSAQNDAESDDYINALQEHLKSRLEDYGDVINLNDEGAEIMVDLDSFIDRHSDLETIFEISENCGEKNYECIFDEIVGSYNFDKPSWNFDDRYIPDVDRISFNDILSDRLSDFM